jgi:hypothetical protein
MTASTGDRVSYRVDATTVMTAFVAGIYPDGSVDLALVEPDNTGGGWYIVGGATQPTRATDASEMLLDGHWWQS